MTSPALRSDGPALASPQLLQVRAVKKYFPVRGRTPFSDTAGGAVRAVDGVSFDVEPARTVSVVGESGSGKTTLARLVLGLEKPTAGHITFEGVDITEHRRWDGPSPIQAVFQDPWGSLNPRMRIERIVSEPMTVRARVPKRDVVDRVTSLLEFVGVEVGARRNFPHEFSGGQRQRIAIARALSVFPKLIVLDEPVSALDVSIRAQIINLLKDVQNEYGTSYLMIAHDLATVRFLSDSVLVMYLGIVVERAPVEQIFDTPLHPYTQALLSASLPLRPGVADERLRLTGEIPSPVDPPSGCRFRTRCPYAFARCETEVPEYRERTPTHLVACHLYEDPGARPIASPEQA